MLALLRALFGGPGAKASVQEAAALLASGGVLVDVRESSEWQRGHAKGAIHVPLGELQARGKKALESRSVRIADGGSVMLICHGGVRSGVACQSLGADGTLRAVNVRGGMLAWQRAGLPMEHAP